MKRINGHISIIYGVSLASCVYLGYLMGGINTTTAGPIKQGTAIAADNKVLIEEIAEQSRGRPDRFNCICRFSSSSLSSY